MLTEQQRSGYKFIVSHMAEHDGLAPSVREMRSLPGLNSTSAVHRILVALEERGYIRRISGRARAIEVIPRASEATRDRLRSAVSPIVEYFGPQARLGQTCAVPASMIIAMRDALVGEGERIA